MTVKEEIESFTRELLAQRLSRCSAAQQELFRRVFPGGPKAEQLETAIDLCDRTIRKNEKDPAWLLAAAVKEAK